MAHVSDTGSNIIKHYSPITRQPKSVPEPIVPRFVLFLYLRTNPALPESVTQLDSEFLMILPLRIVQFIFFQNAPQLEATVITIAFLIPWLKILEGILSFPPEGHQYELHQFLSWPDHGLLQCFGTFIHKFISSSTGAVVVSFNNPLSMQSQVSLTYQSSFSANSWSRVEVLPYTWGLVSLALVPFCVYPRTSRSQKGLSSRIHSCSGLTVHCQQFCSATWRRLCVCGKERPTHGHNLLAVENPAPQLEQNAIHFNHFLTVTSMMYRIWTGIRIARAITHLFQYALFSYS